MAGCAIVLGFRDPRPRPQRGPLCDAALDSSGARCESCTLAACPAGLQATVLCIDCPAHDAQRLRALGLFEGARVGVVDTRSGMVLDIRGSRLALGWDVVAAITVCPVNA